MQSGLSVIAVLGCLGLSRGLQSIPRHCSYIPLNSMSALTGEQAVEQQCDCIFENMLGQLHLSKSALRDPASSDHVSKI